MQFRCPACGPCGKRYRPTLPERVGKARDWRTTVRIEHGIIDKLRNAENDMHAGMTGQAGDESPPDARSSARLLHRGPEPN